MPSTTPRLVFDIEASAENFDEFDEITKKSLTRWIKSEARDEDEYGRLLENLKEELVFSALTSEVVAIGMLDVDKEKGAVYYQSPKTKQEKLEEEGVSFEAKTEAAMLEKFWEVAEKYKKFITFNGRGFDVPFLMIRSAIHKMRPSKNLMAGRYLYQHQADAIHIDLQDQLSFYGATRRRGSLHMWCRAFGIASPKSGEISGDNVSRLFQEKRYLDIARYNVRDLKATRELYLKWEEYINIS